MHPNNLVANFWIFLNCSALTEKIFLVKFDTMNSKFDSFLHTALFLGLYRDRAVIPPIVFQRSFKVSSAHNL